MIGLEKDMRNRRKCILWGGLLQRFFSPLKRDTRKKWFPPSLDLVLSGCAWKCYNHLAIDFED